MIVRVLSTLVFTAAFSASAFALNRIECRSDNHDFFKLKKISTGEEPTWDLSYRFNDPTDGVPRLVTGEKEGMKCKVETNDNLAPVFYCVADDGWKVAFSATIESSFNTDVDLGASTLNRSVGHFFIHLINIKAGKVFLGNVGRACKWE